MPRRKKTRSRRRRWLIGAAIAVVVPLACSIALVLPLRWADPATTAFILQDDSGRRPILQDWVDWDDISQAAVLAVVAAEDQRFTQHFGIDVASIRDSLEDAESGRRLRGASTITQQLAKNLFLWPGRNFLRKGLEAWFTLLLEAFLPKKRILELYLNVAEFGPGIYGVGAASRHYFGKPPSMLRFPEAALLAAVLPNPGRLRIDAPSDYVRDRQRWILGQMHRLQREGWITTLR